MNRIRKPSVVRRLPALLFASAVLLGACGGGEAPSAGPAPAPAPGPTPSPPPPGPSPAPSPSDSQPPTVPTALTATASSAYAVALSWQASSDNVGVAGYRILRNGSQVGTIGATAFQDSGLVPSTSYAYSVIAYDAAGNVSAESSAANATTPAASGNVIPANPGNYLVLLRGLRPGDTLLLAAGNYGVDSGGQDTGDPPGLPIFDLNGTSTAPIIITGSETGPRPVLLGRNTHNTVRFANASYVTVRNIDIDSRNLGGFGVAAQGIAHHITLENLLIRGVGGDQQQVGISSSGSPVWNWIVRGNTIVGAGTGMYFGNSDGTSPFVAGVIERNLFRDTIGYNMQIKRQAVWPTNVSGLPAQPTRTIIRHNVFSKSANSSTGGLARPNLLVGDQPPSGAGTDNSVEIYGNFFWQNPSESLFQGSGNVAFYGNILVNDSGSAMNFQAHDGGVVRNVRVFGNTIISSGSGVSISGGAAGFTQVVPGNAIFAANPVSLTGAATSATENVTDSRANAVNYLNNPNGALGQFNAYPKVGFLLRPALDTTGLSGFTDWDRDFNGAARNWSFRGAYAGEGTNPGWTPKLEKKP